MITLWDTRHISQLAVAPKQPHPSSPARWSHVTLMGSDEAKIALAAWTCFEYRRARESAARAAVLNRAWSPLALLMSLVPDDA